MLRLSSRSPSVVDMLSRFVFSRHRPPESIGIPPHQIDIPAEEFADRQTLIQLRPRNLFLSPFNPLMKSESSQV